jgi:hypothetical protein
MQRAERRHKLPAGLLLAVASRETDMEDIVGDKGHGRGLFQIDDRFHADWLAAHGAPGAATTPRVEDAAEFAASMLASNRAFGSQNGVTGRDRIRFACSAYNAGPGGALEGHRSGDCDRKMTGVTTAAMRSSAWGRSSLGRARELADEWRPHPRKGKQARTSYSRETCGRGSTARPGVWRRSVSAWAGVQPR